MWKLVKIGITAQRQRRPSLDSEGTSTYETSSKHRKLSMSKDHEACVVSYSVILLHAAMKLCVILCYITLSYAMLLC